MNFLGLCMFLAVGGTALHYWHGYQPEHKFEYLVPEKEVLGWIKLYIFIKVTISRFIIIIY